MWIKILLCVALAANTVGCAFMPKRKTATKSKTEQEPVKQAMVSKDELLKVQAQVDMLKKEMDRKDSEIKDLSRELTGVQREYNAALRASQKRGTTVKTVVRRTTSTSALYDPRQIQKALYAAGYYDGPIDGKIGPKTIQGIKDFQTDHDLKADGVVGARTWGRLKEYLEIK